MRIAGRLKLGYFPLPVPEGPRIRARLEFSNELTSVLDPCAGNGSAFLAVTKGANVTRYAFELDANRAEACAATGINTIHGNTIEIDGKVQQISFLYLNPPYDFETGVFSNQRLESVFLQHCFRWLIPGGVLAFVIPKKALHYCINTLSARFTKMQVFRLSHPDSVKFDQVVLFGVRRDQTDKASSRNHDQLVQWYSGYNTIPDLPPADANVGNTYSIPPTPPAAFVHRGIDFDHLEDVIDSSHAWRQSRHAFLPETSLKVGRPLTPLHGGHVGLLATAGLMNGCLGTGEMRHIARWRTIKTSTDINEGAQEDGSVIIRTVQRFTSDLALVFENGKVKTLNETAPVGKADDESEEAASQQNASAAKVKLKKSPRQESRPGAALFKIGRVTTTPAIRELTSQGLDWADLVERHTRGDWGDVTEEQGEANWDALMNGGKLMSSYESPYSDEDAVLVVTNADRTFTTVMLPSEL
jgi:hypothetical protein